jgi:hypothetical protein
VSQAPVEAADMRDFVHAVGESLGDLEFTPGESTLFLSAVEELTGTEALPFLGGSIGETASDETHDFGGLGREDLELVVPALDRFLNETPPTDAGLRTACEKFELQVDRFLKHLQSLRSFLAQALEAGRDVASIYETPVEAP